MLKMRIESGHTANRRGLPGAVLTLLILLCAALPATAQQDGDVPELELKVKAVVAP